MFLSRKGGLSYVARADVATYDFDTSNLTQDGAWHTLNLSAIVPAGAKAVVLRLGAAHSSAGRYFRVAPLGYTQSPSGANVATQVANVINEQTTIMPMNAARTLSYWATSGTWAAIRVCVLGWWI